MKLSKYAENAVDAVAVELKLKLNKKQKEQAVRLVEKAIVDAVVEHRGRCAGVASKVLPKDSDKADAISRAIRRKTHVLIANLSAMR